MKLIYGFMAFFLISVTVLEASAEDPQTIEITILGKPQVDIGSENRLLRANVVITNFDPSDGHYQMQITQLSTQKIIYEKEVFASEKDNQVYGMSVAYMVDEKALSKEGEVTGEYELVVMSESGKAIAKTTFSIINSKYYPNVIIGNSDSSITSQNDNSLNSLTSESKLIPEWIRDIFTWYAEEKISEAELLDAIESLIKLKIIEV